MNMRVLCPLIPTSASMRRRNSRVFSGCLEILHQIAYGEIGRIALPVVAVFLSRLERRHVRHGQLLAPISAALEDRANQILVLPCEATEQDRHAAALFCGKGALDWTVEVGRLVKSGNLPQAHALRFQSLFDLRIIFNLDESRRHGVLRRCIEFGP
jgi:hypothetical protein